MKFYQRPVVTEAIQYLGFDVNGEECELFLGDAFWTHLPSRNKLEIRTSKGPIIANEGDWIIRGLKGDYYLLSPDVFTTMYEPA